MQPRIGVPLCLDDRGRWKRSRSYHYIDAAYASAISAAGGVPVYLPIQRDAASLLDGIDGLLLPGGDDLPPQHPYPPEVSFEIVPESQLQFDGQLLSAALSRELPLLAICYGAQLLAVSFGSTLHYDIATDVPGAGSHRLPEAEGRHALDVVAGSRLADAVGEDPPRVNSLHHQAIEHPGEGLVVSARAPDGLVEAVETNGGAFCVGVQWHPEKLEGVHRDGLFGAFVAACDARQERE